MGIDVYIAVSGLLLMLCVFANKVSDRVGIPSLLLFLGIGMLTGVDGIGGINFQDSRLTNYVGTIALMFILFNGGLYTNWKSVRHELFRGSILATLGVFLTALFLFAGAYYLIKLPFEISLMLSVIISSTDAPAVFSIMRNANIRLPQRLKSMLEFESASNDPMAVFLTAAAIAYIGRPDTEPSALIGFFFNQMAIGVIFGLALGRIAVYVLQNAHLPYPGLYPVYGVSIVFLIYSLTQLVGGSGILALYISGIIVGNIAFLYRRHLMRFIDSLAWIMQISMFLILGLLVNPHELGAIAPAGIACTLILIFIARPLAVFICLFRSRFNISEQALISWAGLKGAVPIILATYPLLEKIPNAQYIFNLIFFLVVFSVLFQGKTLPYLAARLHLDQNLEEKDNDDDESSISRDEDEIPEGLSPFRYKIAVLRRSAYRAGRYLREKVSGRKIKRSSCPPPSEEEQQP